MIALPDDAELAALTRSVLRADAVQGDDPARAGGRADRHRRFPAVSARSSPIKHVFYVIRENRTYDQMLGDVAAATAIRR